MALLGSCGFPGWPRGLALRRGIPIWHGYARESRAASRRLLPRPVLRSPGGSSPGAVRHIRPVFRQESVPGLKWRPTSIASGPARARVRDFNGCPRDYQAAFLRRPDRPGWPADRPVPRSPNPCPAAAPPIPTPAAPPWIPSPKAAGKAWPTCSGRPTRRRHPPDADRVAGHRPYRAPAQPWRQRHRAGHDRKAPAETKGQRGTDVQLMFQHARPGRPARRRPSTSTPR